MVSECEFECVVHLETLLWKFLFEEVEHFISFSVCDISVTSDHHAEQEWDSDAVGIDVVRGVVKIFEMLEIVLFLVVVLQMKTDDKSSIDTTKHNCWEHYYWREKTVSDYDSGNCGYECGMKIYSSACDIQCDSEGDDGEQQQIAVVFIQ